MHAGYVDCIMYVLCTHSHKRVFSFRGDKYNWKSERRDQKALLSRCTKSRPMSLDGTIFVWNIHFFLGGNRKKKCSSVFLFFLFDYLIINTFLPTLQYNATKMKWQLSRSATYDGLLRTIPKHRLSPN